MDKLDLLMQFALPLLLSYFGYKFGKKRSEAETEKIRVQTEIDQISLEERRIASYKNQLVDMQQEIEALRAQVFELKVILENLTANQCIGDACNYKIDLDKIMAKRAARKVSTAKKDEVKK